MSLLQKSCLNSSYSQEDLAACLHMPPGGGFSGYIQALEQADFVKVFSPLSVTGQGQKTKKIVLWDEWLRFYFSYIKPNKHVIDMNSQPGLCQQLTGKSMEIYFGLAFERFCIKNISGLLSGAGIALNEILGYGPFFRQPGRKGQSDAGLQIDILVHRRGHILSVFECKFQTSPVGMAVIQEVERKVALLRPKRFYTIEKMLVCAGPVTRDLEQSGYFHKILSLDALFT